MTTRSDALPGAARAARAAGWGVFAGGVLLVGPAVLCLPARVPAEFRHRPLPARELLLAGWAVAAGAAVGTARPPGE